MAKDQPVGKRCNYNHNSNNNNNSFKDIQGKNQECIIIPLFGKELIVEYSTE